MYTSDDASAYHRYVHYLPIVTTARAAEEEDSILCMHACSWREPAYSLMS